MKKRTLLSRRKAVKCLTILAVMFAAAIPATAREAKAAAGTTFKVKVSDGYLALRSEKAFDKSNEIGQLNTGDLVEVTDRKDPTYWYAYVPRLDRSGYLDKNYIQVAESTAASNDSWTVKVKSGYLALRSEKAFDKSNEIGQLNTGDLVEVTDRKDPTYWYAYVPRLDRSGYLDKNYIQVAESTAASNDSWTVKVKSGYLALRNTAAYNDSNEIGRLNTGDMVLVKDSSDSTYWYVYVPKLDKSGYVDNRYIYNSGLWTVKIEKGYLALRNQAAYNDSNEIGQLNTGDTVQVKDTADEHYWYVYVPKLDKTGYVDKEYLLGGAGTAIQSMTVKVDKGYLAFRSEKAYDKNNEIGQLNTGDTVELIEKEDSTYWYVFVPKLGKEGYVDKNYLK